MLSYHMPNDTIVVWFWRDDELHEDWGLRNWKARGSGWLCKVFHWCRAERRLKCRWSVWDVKETVSFHSHCVSDFLWNQRLYPHGLRWVLGGHYLKGPRYFLMSIRVKKNYSWFSNFGEHHNHLESWLKPAKAKNRLLELTPEFLSQSGWG